MKTADASVGAFEAKNKFSELLKRVGRETEITITKHDRAVARLVPAVLARPTMAQTCHCGTASLAWALRRGMAFNADMVCLIHFLNIDAAARDCGER